MVLPVLQIQRWALHLHASEDTVERLSATEMDFLEAYVAAKDAHMDASVMDAFPREFQDLSLTAPDRLLGPRLAVHVYAKVTGVVGRVQSAAYGAEPLDLTKDCGYGVLYEAV